MTTFRTSFISKHLKLLKAMIGLSYKLYPVRHSGLDLACPALDVGESSVFLDSCLRRNDRPRMI